MRYEIWEERQVWPFIASFTIIIIDTPLNQISREERNHNKKSVFLADLLSLYTKLATWWKVFGE